MLQTGYSNRVELVPIFVALPGLIQYPDKPAIKYKVLPPISCPAISGSNVPCYWPSIDDQNKCSINTNASTTTEVWGFTNAPPWAVSLCRQSDCLQYLVSLCTGYQPANQLFDPCSDASELPQIIRYGNPVSKVNTAYPPMDIIMSPSYGSVCIVLVGQNNGTILFWHLNTDDR